MDESIARAQVAETGRLLLQEQLVARTWGNFSARIEGDLFCITPSGLGYENMTAEDTVLYNAQDGSYQGSRKPSSEKGIHAAAYQLLPDVNFVVHTHQIYATALGLTGPESISITPEENKSLGTLAFAAYGLPGTKKLKQAVTAALAAGAHTVMMVNHGALVCGSDREDAIRRARLLEDICRRSCKASAESAAGTDSTELLGKLQNRYPTADIAATPELLAWAKTGKALPAQLDDMAQMIGLKIPAAKSEEKALSLLAKHNAVFLPGVGALVRGEEADDSEALKILSHKAALAALHCAARGKKVRLPVSDAALMRFIYRQKYSKKKKA